MCIHTYRCVFQFVPHREHSVRPSEKPTDFFLRIVIIMYTVWQNAETSVFDPVVNNFTTRI